MKREEIMRRFRVLAWSLSIGAAVFYGPAAAFATPTRVVAVGAQCRTLESDCATPDPSFAVTSVQVSVNAAGVWTSTCTGTTTFRPAQATVCKGETLNGASGDSDPQFEAEMALVPNGAEPAHFTDDWSETITPSGQVTMTSKLKVNESGN
jgi:hypothetical protein